MSRLYPRLQALRPELARVAQAELDAWQPDQDGIDEVFGGGGACEAIAQAMSSVLGRQIDGIEIVDGGHEGDDHAYLIVYDDREAYEIDIPPSVYETGGGYSWTKIAGVQIQPGDIVINKIDRVLMNERAPNPARLGAGDRGLRRVVAAGWNNDGTGLVRKLTFDTMGMTSAFKKALDAEADAQNHHPEYPATAPKWIKVRWSTHDAGGITARDVEMAERTDDIARALLARTARVHGTSGAAARDRAANPTVPDPRRRFLEDMGLEKLLTGQSLILYHGSSRKFDAFDAEKTRTDLVDLYYGSGLFFVSREDIAWDYAHAARNADLPVSVVDDVERAHPEIGRFMRRSMVSGGLEWPEEWAHLPQREIDLFYEAASVVPYVEGSRVPCTRLSAFEELLGATPGITLSAYKGLHELLGKKAEDYFPRVYMAIVKARNPLVTNELDVARVARRDGYDSVVYFGDHAVGGVPEVAVFDPSQVTILGSKVMTLDESSPTWSARRQNPAAHAYLSLAECQRWEPLAERLGVSEVARSPRGFLTAYKAAGGHAGRLSPAWRARREAFIARHMAQVEINDESLFRNGQPSRRHLALIMWAYSPVAARLEGRASNPAKILSFEEARRERALRMPGPKSEADFRELLIRKFAELGYPDPAKGERARQAFEREVVDDLVRDLYRYQAIGAERSGNPVYSLDLARRARASRIGTEMSKQLMGPIYQLVIEHGPKHPVHGDGTPMDDTAHKVIVAAPVLIAGYGRATGRW